MRSIFYLSVTQEKCRQGCRKPHYLLNLSSMFSPLEMYSCSSSAHVDKVSPVAVSVSAPTTRGYPWLWGIAGWYCQHLCGLLWKQDVSHTQWEAYAFKGEVWPHLQSWVFGSFHFWFSKVKFLSKTMLLFIFFFFFLLLWVYMHPFSKEPISYRHTACLLVCLSLL